VPSRASVFNRAFKAGVSVLPARIAYNISKNSIESLITLADAIGVVGASGLKEDKYGFLIKRPDVDTKEYENIYRKDARVRSAIDLTTYYTIGVGFEFISDDEELIKKAEKIREKTKMDEWVNRAIKVMLITGDTFTEIRKKDDKMALMILPTSQIKVNRDEHGVIPDENAYSQVVGDGREPIQFKYEKIVHTYNPYSSDVKGVSILAAAKYAIDCLWSLEKLMLTITEKFAAPIIIAEMGSPDIMPSPKALKDMKDALGKIDIDKNRLWAVPSLINFKQLESSRAAFNVSPYLDYFERQVYAALMVPPVLMGKPGDSNRSSANVMMDSFERYCRSLQRIMAESIKTILHRYGMGEVPEIVFNPIAQEDEDAMILRYQRMLGSDRSTGWATRDEIRNMTPGLQGTWAEAVDKQTIPEKEKEGFIKPPVQGPEGTPGGPARPPPSDDDEEEEPEDDDNKGKKDDGERAKERPATDRGSEFDIDTEYDNFGRE